MPLKLKGYCDCAERLRTTALAQGMTRISASRLWVEEALKTVCLERDSHWTENLAVGSKAFVEGYQSRMGVRVQARNVGQNQEDWFLREPAATYSMFSGGKIQL